MIPILQKGKLKLMAQSKLLGLYNKQMADQQFES